MTTAHTPGPWEVVDTGDATNLDIDDEFGMDGGRDYSLATVWNGDPKELRANANLVAAAPELLASLKACLLAMESDLPPSVNQPELIAARAAIAKATGAVPDPFAGIAQDFASLDMLTEKEPPCANT